MRLFNEQVAIGIEFSFLNKLLFRVGWFRWPWVHWCYTEPYEFWARLWHFKTFHKAFHVRYLCLGFAVKKII